MKMTLYWVTHSVVSGWWHRLCDTSHNTDCLLPHPTWCTSMCGTQPVRHT